MDFSLLQAIWTIIVMVIFIGIVIWAWSGKRKESFDEAARIPMDDDDEISEPLNSAENKHG